jgi:dihydrofolate reductase
VTRISLIVAVARNGVIGRDNTIPWRIRSEQRFFKETTMGRPLVMGRLTWESLKRPLPGRANLVVSRTPGYAAPGAEVFPSLPEALDAARRIAERDGVDELFVMGGAGLYAEALELADRIYLTEVDLAPEGDVRFPAFDRSRWREVSRTPHPATAGEPGYTVLVLDRR